MLDKLCMKFIRYKILLLIICSLLLSAFPLVITSRYFIRIAIVCLMYAMLVLSLNLMSGMLGLISFGHAAFWGIGAYTAAILATKIGLTSDITFIAAGLIAGCFGFLLSLPVLNLKGYYFTIVTMVFCLIIQIVEKNWMGLTGGMLGIKAIPSPRFFGLAITTQVSFYYLILVMAAITVIIIRNIMNSRVGIAVLAIRDDSLAAEAMGVNIFKYKAMIIVISAMIAGVAGAFYAQYTSYIDPTIFSNDQSNIMLLMAIFGGLGNILGSIIGAVILSVLPEVLRDFAQYRQITYGALLIALMLLKPEGLLGSINFKYIGQRLNASKTLDGGMKNE